MDRVTTTDGGDLAQYKAWFKADREHSAKWRKAAKEDFEFLAGEQWSEAEKRDLKEQMRPAITFNRTHTVINAVSGMEVANRQEVKYFPREAGDAKANELLTEGSKWFRDQADADDEDSDAFLDSSVCGMGWTETTMDYDEEEEGCPSMSAVNPLEMYWDKNARKKNVVDAQRLWRAREVPIARALDMFPDAQVADLDAKWAQVDRAGDEAESQEEADRYDGESDQLVRDDKCVTIVHLQLKKRVPVYVVADMMTQTQVTLDKAEWQKLKGRMAEIGMPLISTRKDEMQVENVFIGSKVLQAGPALCKKHFSFQCITAYMDRTTGLFYGLMRMMKDPQRWANKWMLQALHILNSNAKGGLIAEQGAIEDVRAFEKNWARPDKIAEVAAGSLGQHPRIQPKPQAQMPASFFQMMQFAIEAVREVPGVSLELLGQRESDQPASLEYQRRQAGMTILAPLFDNLKRYRRDHGKLMLYIIQTYLNDGRLVRIVGEEGAKYVPLALKADAKYDIVIDDQANSPDQKMMIWQTLVPMLKLIPPQIQLALLEYSPLPTSVVEKVKAAAAKMQEEAAGQPNPEMVKAQAQAGLAQAKMQQTQMDMQASQQEAVAAQQERQAEAVMRQRELVAQLTELQAKAANDQQKGQIDAMLGQQQIVLGQLAIQLAEVNLKNVKAKPRLEAKRAENAKAA